ncbi:MAG TPA: M15 family metallopeptidase [Patescibacteria group bacterium]|nr:M15 family metallopeptidase [Patescibacteria group bacterium]
MMPAIACAADKVTLEIGIGKTFQVANLTEYITNLYKFLVGTIGILSAAMIMLGGLQWAAAAGNSSQITEAKTRIIDAFIGLIIALSSYVILYTLNPDLVVLKNVTFPAPSIPSSATSGTCDKKSQKCIMAGSYAYLSTQAGSEAHLVDVLLDDGLGNSFTLKVNETAKTAFEAVFAEIKQNNLIQASGLQYAIHQAGAYNWRANRNNSACLSSHSFGFAIDINWDNNPNCQKDSACYSDISTPTTDICASYNANTTAEACDFPDWLITAFKKNGFSWGGDWSSVKDYMHFEWTGHTCGVL